MLVVEDDWLVQSVIVDELRKAGWTVLEAECLKSANAAVSRGLLPDVLFTDIDLKGPELGWDIAENFRKRQPALGVLYTSGITRERSRSVDGSIFFIKPYEPSDIIEACFAVMSPSK